MEERGGRVGGAEGGGGAEEERKRRSDLVSSIFVRSICHVV